MKEDPYDLRRVGLVMEPEAGNPAEAWGVLNPGAARLRDGTLLLYPRAVAEGNYSRIERAEVRFDEHDNPIGVDRKGFALEPETEYELDARSHGGVEDPRVTFVADLQLYVMAYTALGRLGPRIALAVSQDAWTWRRLGLVKFERELGIDPNRLGNKDAMLFPLPVRDREGRLAYPLLHRPTYLLQRHDGTVERVLPRGVIETRPSIWISYVSAERARADPEDLIRVHDSALLATPHQPWEALKIGAGGPPILTQDGWQLYYHGASGFEGSSTRPKDVCYRVGVMVLDRDDPRRILYRSQSPVFEPQEANERHGIVNNVVFPTAVDVRGDRIDLYYGAADERIGVATSRACSEVMVAPAGPSPAWAATPKRWPDPP